MHIFSLSMLFFALNASFVSLEAHVEQHEEIYLQPNTTQIFTELYQNYGLLNPLQRTFFEEALYLDQSIPPTRIPLQPSNIAIFNHASQVLEQFHLRMQDLELYKDPKESDYFFYTAVGSKQLIVALVYGMVMSEPNKKFLFVEQAPFYSGHPNAVTGIYQYPNAQFLAFHDPSEIPVDPNVTLVEFVTSPNNPDGTFRKPVTDAKIIIADFVFASSAFGADGTGYLDANIEWIKEARKAGKHIFSFNSASKQFGKTSTRCGYMWYPLYDAYAALIFNKFFGYISASTVAAGSSGLAEFLNLIKALLDLPDGGRALRKDANQSLKVRHRLLEKEFLQRYPGSLVTSIPGSPTFFAKVNDPRIPPKTGTEVIREDLAVSVNDGASMGETTAYIRANISGYSESISTFLNRLAGQEKYKPSDLLLSPVKSCPCVTVSGEGCCKETVYVVRPGDCRVAVDATNGPVCIELVPWIDYLGKWVVTIEKIDASDHPVEIAGEGIVISLNKKGDRTILEWLQPSYVQGVQMPRRIRVVRDH